MSDSHPHSSTDFSRSKFLLVAFLVLVLEGGDLDPFDLLLLSSELRSPGGPVDAGVVAVVPFSW